jgi:hypothetical protein
LLTTRLTLRAVPQPAVGLRLLRDHTALLDPRREGARDPADHARAEFKGAGLAIRGAGNAAGMLLLLLIVGALGVLGVVLAVVVIKWLFILAVVAALIWVIAFFARGISGRA